MLDRFENAYAQEKLVLAFQYGDELEAGETLTGTPAAAVTVLQGTDPAPDTLLNGAPLIVGSDVLVPIDPTVSDVDYRIKVVVPTSNPQKVLACVGRLYVEP